MAQGTATFSKADGAGPAWERRAPRPEDDHVLESTLTWLNSLPTGARPVHLPARFPRIANELARLWSQVPALDSYFEDKAYSLRDDRRGFSPLILEELQAMHIHSMRSRSPTHGDR